MRARTYGDYLPVMLQLLDPKKEETILDVGAGIGYIASRVAKSCDNVYALEPNDDKVEFVKSHFPEVKAFSGNVSSIPFPESYFNKIYVVAALHHFRDQDMAVNEMARVLKSSGRILIHESNPERMGAKAETRLAKGVRFIESSRLKEIVEGQGFKMVELRNVRSSYFLLAEKE